MSKKNNVAVQDNSLIEASYLMTLNEKRLLILGISRVDPHQLPNESSRDLFDFSITADEWLSVYSDDKNPYQSMSRAANDLLSRQITLHKKTGKRSLEKMNWLDSVVFKEREGTVDIRFSYSVSLRLAGMADQFTKMHILDVNKFTSVHSVRIYELIRQFDSTGFRKIMLEDLRFSLALEDKYPTIKELKRRVLNPAVDEINTKSPIQVVCTDLKKGRKIVGFQFTQTHRKRVNKLEAKATLEPTYP